MENIIVGSTTALRDRLKNFSISDWTQFSVTVDWTNMTSVGWYRIVGKSIDLRYLHTLTGVPVLGTVGLRCNLPVGIVPDRTNSYFATSMRHGYGAVLDNNTGIQYDLYCRVWFSDPYYVDSATLQADEPTVSTATSITATHPHTFAVNDKIYYEVFGIPILNSPV